MKIKVKSQAHETIYPDIENNIELPEEKRFAIVMRRPPRVELWAKLGVSESDQVDIAVWARAHVVELRNAPTLTFDDGTSREMTVADIFEFDDLIDLQGVVIATANKFHEKTPENDPKN